MSQTQPLVPLVTATRNSVATGADHQESFRAPVRGRTGATGGLSNVTTRDKRRMLRVVGGQHSSPQGDSTHNRNALLDWFEQERQQCVRQAKRVESRGGYWS
jgi:hypothetical protein